MTASTAALSRRSLVAVAAASLLAGCQGSGGAGGRDSGAPPAGAAPSPRSSGASRRPSSSDGSPSPSPLGRSVPVRLLIPAIGVDTPVMGLGLAADGTVEVPPVTEHDRAGWYRHSPTPGETGPSVILGHVTVGAYGDGVFRRLAGLRRGARITARRADGSTAEFTVDRLRTVAKSDFPAAEVYGNADRPELRLITCGGPRSGQEYRDNVIVFATLSATGQGGERAR
ncbi:class F sortase [Streptomyces sp. HM190]|uniref:class F sortase n=1 Tax=Streptomyces sp. HM190 TaxID=2695266 RepID=UPI00135CF72A|nr:class F sortase [Streptomyces sp. HM190]